MIHRCVLAVAAAVVFAGWAVPEAGAAAAASEKDRAFVAKVSQGGTYEVEASKLAEDRAIAADVKDLAVAEVHDHGVVNRGLKRIADAAGVAVAAEFDDEFKQRLARLTAAPAAAFDAAYLKDMAQIHDKDEKLFANEAEQGTGDFVAFARQTDRIVKRHIGALHALD